MHKWVKKELGKASNYICECGERAREWSNIDHSYKRNLKDYTAKCISCHKKFDYKFN